MRETFRSVVSHDTFNLVALEFKSVPLALHEKEGARCNSVCQCVSLAAVFSCHAVCRKTYQIRLVVTSFYDDFCQLELQELAGSAQGTAQLVLQLLGWRIAEDPNKCLPFSKVFSMLGAQLFAGKSTPRNLGDIQQGGQAASFEDDGERSVH